MKKKKNGGFHPTFREIFICAKKELAPFATVFVYAPENFDTQKFGTFFGVIKVDDHSESSSYVVNLLTSVIKKEYFSKLHRTPEESFEAGLRKANLALAELARHGATGWAGKIHFAGGALEKNNLHFSCLGDVSVLLVRAGQLASISEELEEEKEAETHPLKTFSNISSGKLEKGDKLILTTNELTDIFSNEELRQNSSHFSREEFPGFLEISLGANSELAGTIIVDYVEESAVKTVSVEAPLIGRETIRSIESTFTPDPAAPTMERPATGPQTAAKAHGFEETDSELFREKSGGLGKTAAAFGMVALKSSKNLAHGLISFFSGSIQKIKLKERIQKPDWSSAKQKASAMIGRAKPQIGKFKDGISHFTAQKSTFKYGIAALGAIIAVSFVWIFFIRNGNEPAPPSPTEPENIVTTPQIPEDTNIRQIENIEEAIVLGQNILRFVFLNDLLYVISGSNKSVVKIDPVSKNTEELASNLGTGNFALLAAMPDLNTLFILTADNKAVSFTPINKNFQENSIALPAGLKAVDMKSFLTYLYFLDPAANQIYRYPRSEGGFGDVQNWLRAGSDIKAAKSFSVNDDLFTASDSQLTPYLQGRKDEKISFESPTVALAIDRVYSEPGLEGVYALDNANHRIVKFSKDGKIAAQFWHADISGVKDFIVDEKNKVVYFAKENKLLKFSME